MKEKVKIVTGKTLKTQATAKMKAMGAKSTQTLPMRMVSRITARLKTWILQRKMKSQRFIHL